MENQITIETLLVTKFGGRTHIAFVDALDAIGYHIPTARNQRCAGTFPLNVEQRGKRLYITLPELIRYASAKQIKRGRKSKAEKLAGRGGIK